MSHPKNEQPFEDPSDVSASSGEVCVDGPDGIAYSMSPEAAVETGNRLHDEGVLAQGQLVEARNAAAKSNGGKEQAMSDPDPEPSSEQGDALEEAQEDAAEQREEGGYQ